MSIGGTSFLERSLTQANRLKDLNTTLIDLQRQVTTQKKSETLSGLGLEAENIQRHRTEANQTQVYIDNIDTASSRINTMTDIMERVTELGQQLMGSIQTQVREGTVDIQQIHSIARNGLDFIQQMLNIEIGGRHLFAGTDTTNNPLADMATLNANFQTEVADWLSGAQTEAALESNVDAFLAGSLGYAPTLSSSGTVFARIHDNIDLDYTVRADSAGFQQVLKGLALAANLEIPDPSIDIGTMPEFHDILDKIIRVTSSGINEVRSDLSALGGKLNLMQSLKENHTRDIELLKSAIADVENADTTETVLKLQSVQQQLTASYEITRVVNQLSLINYI